MRARIGCGVRFTRGIGPRWRRCYSHSNRLRLAELDMRRNVTQPAVCRGRPLSGRRLSSLNRAGSSICVSRWRESEQGLKWVLRI